MNHEEDEGKGALVFDPDFSGSRKPEMVSGGKGVFFLENPDPGFASLDEIEKGRFLRGEVSREIAAFVRSDLNSLDEGPRIGVGDELFHCKSRVGFQNLTTRCQKIHRPKAKVFIKGNSEGLRKLHVN